MNRAILVASVCMLMVPIALVGQEEPQTSVLDQSAPPIEIVSYQADYQEGGTYSREGISHELEYRNSSDRPVRAVKFGLLSFNVFNDFLDRTAGIDMDKMSAGDTANGTWISTAYAAFSFFSGVAYVEQVRFLDGDIWEADLDAIAAQVRDIEADFKADRLKGEPDRNGSQ